jgi:hypothetical protein
MSRYYRSYLEESGSAYTTRTTAFATATGITDTTILGALNTFDLGLISNGLDTKMKALYPFVGGTATTHKFNFMDARDLDAAFRLTFFGGGTHGSYGYLGNATNSYGETYFNIKTQIPSQITSLGSYLVDNTGTPDAFIGGGAVGFSCISQLSVARLVNSDFGIYIENDGQYIHTTISNPTGLLIANRLNSTTINGWRNGSKVIPDAANNISTTTHSFTLTFNGYNDAGTKRYFPSKKIGFTFIGDGLNDTEAGNLSTLISNMQVSLSRAV